ncbi:MAG: protein kinase [Planctomycetes bacterium]|nr:protein kinase [Planctomycetota bacterium]
MSAIACQQACIHIAFKRGLAGYDEMRSFVAVLRGTGIASVPELRRWLGGTQHGFRRLADRLALLLPPPGGERLGRIELWFHLADGGSGRAWLASAVATRTGADGQTQPQEVFLVVKLLHPDVVGSPEARARFEREIAITESVQDPLVVRCLGHGIDAQGRPYLLLAYVDGGDLRTLIERSGRLVERDALLIAHQAALGLALVHRAGIVHRDIKPHNIFLTRQGAVKLADFGAARILEGSAALTMPGQTHGSPLYIAPEQAFGEPGLDGRADVYALACVLYHALSGQPPFPGGNAGEVLRAHRERQPQPLANVSPALGGLLRRALAKRPEGRPTAQVFADEVAALLSKQGVAPVTPLSEATIALSCAEVKAGTDPAIPPASGSGLRPAAASGSRPALAAPPPVIRPSASTPSSRDGIGDAANDAELTLPPASASAARAAVPAAAAGDWATAIAADWLVLRGPGPLLLSLHARRRLLFGRLLKPPTEVCLRLYPPEAHAEDNGRVGREHWALEWSAAARRAQVSDRGSSNGTALDGRTLNPDQPWPLEAGRTHRLQVGTMIELTLAVLPQRSRQETAVPGAPRGGGHPCGIDSDASDDAVVVRRLGNRPELAYAQVLRRLVVGGVDSDLPLPGVATGRAAEVARFAGRWVWRPLGDALWQPIRPGARLLAAGMTLSAAAGTPEALA